MSSDERELSRMLELYREGRSPDAAVQSRVWASVEAGVAPTSGAATGAEQAAAGSALASGTGAKLLAVAALVALGGLAWYATGEQRSAPARSAPREASGAPAPAPPAAQPLVHEPTQVAAEEPGVADATRALPPRSADKPRSRAAAPDASSLAKELKLVAAAQAAVQSGNHESALRLLQHHAQRFPTGALAEEREAALVDALCGVGRKVEAAATAERFVARFPGSPRSSRVRAACAEPPP
jgi:TolA-binding protein